MGRRAGAVLAVVTAPSHRGEGWGGVCSIKNLYIPLCPVLDGKILVSSRLGPRMKSVWNMNSQAHDNMSALPRQNDDDDGCSKCTATAPILLL
jgi:hypothetical protein